MMNSSKTSTVCLLGSVLVLVLASLASAGPVTFDDKEISETPYGFLIATLNYFEPGSACAGCDIILSRDDSTDWICSQLEDAQLINDCNQLAQVYAKVKDHETKRAFCERQGFCEPQAK